MRIKKDSCTTIEVGVHFHATYWIIARVGGTVERTGLLSELSYEKVIIVSGGIAHGIAAMFRMVLYIDELASQPPVSGCGCRTMMH